MHLTDAQLQTLATAIRAETDPVAVNARSIGDMIALTAWINSDSAVDAWNPAMSKRDLFEATDVTKFDGLTVGKRDAWKLLMDNSPIDMGRNKMRNAVKDSWGVTDSVAVLQACTRKANRAENYFGGVSQTTNTVTALKLNVPGLMPRQDLEDALNRFPA